MANNTIYRFTICKGIPGNFPAVGLVQGDHGRSDPFSVESYSRIQFVWGCVEL